MVVGGVGGIRGLLGQSDLDPVRYFLLSLNISMSRLSRPCQ